ncbi:MAG: peptide chain release factor N(5)-glutamine methyltransferase [Rectinemataceae bacterium]|nr:peptide chain release factor N(5)-glutamine methyltransferase [Rectinemataceae bacterium]
MQRVGQTLIRAVQRLQKAGITTFRLDAQVLLAHALQSTREEILMNSEQEISPEQQALFASFLLRRTQREPVSHIIGKREFWAMEFIVTKDVLDPRPDSETLIEAALGCFKDKNAGVRILDIGAGSGCLLLALLSEFPCAHGVGTDISAAALEVASQNAAKLGLANRAEFVLNDLHKGLQEYSFDLIVSNPPYIKKSDIESLEPELRYEPELALSGGRDGLDVYRAIIPSAGAFLCHGGWLLMEIGNGQYPDIEKMLFQERYEEIKGFSDLAGTPRCIAARNPFKD